MAVIANQKVREMMDRLYFKIKHIANKGQEGEILNKEEEQTRAG